MQRVILLTKHFNTSSMEIARIETLLLQEMEDVKGGRAGACHCDKGAGQGPDGDGDCYCKLGGAGMVTVSPDPGCFCGTVGGAGM